MNNLEKILKEQEIEFNIDSEGDIQIDGYLPQEVDIAVCDVFANDRRFDENSEFYSDLNSTFFSTPDGENIEMTRKVGNDTYILVSNLSLPQKGKRRQRLSPSFFREEVNTSSYQPLPLGDDEEEKDFHDFESIVEKAHEFDAGHGVDVLRGCSSQDYIEYKIFSFSPVREREYETTLRLLK